MIDRDDGPGTDGTSRWGIVLLVAVTLVLQGISWRILDGYQVADSVEFVENAQALVRGHEVLDSQSIRSAFFPLLLSPPLLVADLLGVEDNPVLATAKELEKQALADDYFVDRKLFPNVDFYSGVILEAMGFPLSMFTPIFAVGRTVGWVSQWKEMLNDPQNKIGRPRQLYLGETARDYVDIENR